MFLLLGMYVFGLLCPAIAWSTFASCTLDQSTVATVPCSMVPELAMLMQISLNQPSCFAYAEVAVAVSQKHPGFAELMIAKLHEVLPCLHLATICMQLFPPQASHVPLLQAEYAIPMYNMLVHAPPLQEPALHPA